MYLIRHLCHRTGVFAGGHGFSVDLSPEFKDAVSVCDLDQEKINQRIATCGAEWLDAAGYGENYDPDNCGHHRDRTKSPGPNAKRLYEPRTSIRVQWGEWGPEHITVPGNACGLDIERGGFCGLFKGGAKLLPHNVDCLAQKYLLLIVFTEIAEDLASFMRLNCK